MPQLGHEAFNSLREGSRKGLGASDATMKRLQGVEFCNGWRLRGLCLGVAEQLVPSSISPFWLWAGRQCGQDIDYQVEVGLDHNYCGLCAPRVRTDIKRGCGL